MMSRTPIVTGGSQSSSRFDRAHPGEAVQQHARATVDDNRGTRARPPAERANRRDVLRRMAVAGIRRVGFEAEAARPVVSDPDLIRIHSLQRDDPERGPNARRATRSVGSGSWWFHGCEVDPAATLRANAGMAVELEE